MPDPPQDRKPPGRDPTLEELRRLLIGDVAQEVNSLRSRLDDPVLHAEDVSRVLPESVLLRSKRDSRLARALAPVVEESITASVRRNPRPLANALFPVIGPAIRKAVAEMFRGMIQTVNQILNHSFSLQGLRWRMEAIRTGRPFGEIVLLHSLLYRVEQVFLIHRDSGLLLQHLMLDPAAGQDADMISAMLTAIMDFVHDSFRSLRRSELGTIHFGDLTVFIEKGPQAILAGVIQGNPPEELRSVFQDTLEIIHLEKQAELEAFAGDTTPFETLRPRLEECLQSQYKATAGKPSPFLWVSLATLLLILAMWTHSAIETHRNWARYLDRLRAEPGLVVTASDRHEGRFHVNGLRDPLARDPIALLRGSGIDPGKVVGSWSPFQSLAPPFVLKRAAALLAPPDTVSLALHDGVLHVSGSAPYEWIQATRTRGPMVAGISGLDTAGLQALEAAAARRLIRSIENAVILFELGSAQLAPDQADSLYRLSQEILQLHALSRLLGQPLSVDLMGRTDSSGTPDANEALSRQRAAAIQSYLVLRGVQPALLTPVGAAARSPLQTPDSAADPALNRSVTFHVNFSFPPGP